MRGVTSSLGFLLGLTIMLIGCGGETFPEGAYGSIQNAVCSSLAVSRDVSSPSAPGADVTFTATAGCDGGDTPEYQWFIRRPGDPSYTMVQAYGGGDSWTWTNGAEAAGLYHVLVYTRASGATESYETWRAVSHQLASGDTCASNPSLTGQRTGTDINLSGSVTCGGTATPEYLFYARGPQDTTFSMIRDWGASSTYAFDVTSADAGAWTFIVYTRAVGSSAAYEGSAYRVIYNASCDALTVGHATLGSKQYRITGTASCTGGSSAEYAFFVKVTGTTVYTPIRDWGTAGTFDWDATGFEDGDYTLLMYVRARDTSTYDDWEADYITLGDTGSCGTTESISATPSASEQVGTEITLAASVTCTQSATAESAFYIKRPGETSYALLRDWGATSYAWATDTEPAGSYAILVYSRAQGSIPVESWGARSVTLTAAP